MIDNFYDSDNALTNNANPLLGDQREPLVEKRGIYQVYSYRWVVLIVFVLSGVANAMVLLTWAPITDKAQAYWDNIDITAVNLLSVAFQICYVPGTLLALRFSERCQLRELLIRGGGLTCLGCVFRVLGAIFADQLGANGSYAVILLGTIFVGLSQPFYLNMPAKIATAWFGVNERDIATTLCSLANPLGSAIGSLIPAMFVTAETDDTDGVNEGIRNLLITQMIVAFAAIVLAYLFLKSYPESPPSAAAEQMQRIQESKGLNTILFDMKQLFDNVEYLKLLFAFSIVLGNLNAVAALLNQLPGDYSNDEIGLSGAVLIMTGFLGAFATGFILDCSKSYHHIVKIAYFLTVICWVFFFSNCRENNFPLFIASAALLGGATLPTSKSLHTLFSYASSYIYIYIYSSFHDCGKCGMFISRRRGCLCGVIVHVCQSHCHCNDLHWTSIIIPREDWSCSFLSLCYLGYLILSLCLLSGFILPWQNESFGSRCIKSTTLQSTLTSLLVRLWKIVLVR